MPDDLKNSGPQDRARINVHEAWELSWWIQELGLTAQELRELVRQHGVSAAKVREILAAQRKR